MNPKLLSSDAWVLLATIYAGQGKPAPLAAVIGAADYIQHAVLVFEEMEGALARLTEARYVVFKNGTLTPSKDVFAHHQSITKPHSSVHTELAELERFLHAGPWNSGAEPQHANIGAAFPMLTREAFNQAVASYVRSVA